MRLSVVIPAFNEEATIRAILTEAATVYLKDPLADPVEEEWWGWRPMTFDGLPVIDRSPAMRNVLISRVQPLESSVSRETPRAGVVA